ncbi:hypothetical protein ACJJTC_009176 [Scirpophaga incertulas]
MLMVQTNAQPMKTTKVKGPPPVPPRPNQSVVAEALAKTRKAVAESNTNNSKSRIFTKREHSVTVKSKTLDRNTINQISVSPKQNGLARVKSFIKDVISDRSSSSDERRSSGQNSRRSSSDSSTTPISTAAKRSNESLNSKAVKTCKQILVRSLSTSNKLDQDAKCSKVTKSSSFAEKTLPLRKAPPPPLSPKPKLKPMKPLIIQRNSINSSCSSLKHSPEVSPYSSPIDAKSPQSPLPEAPYATVEEVQEFDDRLRNSPCKQSKSPTCTIQSSTSLKCDESINRNTNSLERKTSRVTEMLISEILASRNDTKSDENTVIDKGKNSEQPSNNDPTEKGITKDMNNHEMLIYELQNMRSQSNVHDVLTSNENSASDLFAQNGHCDSDDSEQNYPVSSVTSGNTEDGCDQTYTYILDDDLKYRLRKQFRAISTMSLQGLPPLPKSLSGFADGESGQESPSSPGDPPPADLDSQLTYLKKEMVCTYI